MNDGVEDGRYVNLYIRSREKDAKQSSFLAGPFLVLNWTFPCSQPGWTAVQSAGLSLPEPMHVAPRPWTAAVEQMEAKEEEGRSFDLSRVIRLIRSHGSNFGKPVSTYRAAVAAEGAEFI